MDLAARELSEAGPRQGEIDAQGQRTRGDQHLSSLAEGINAFEAHLLIGAGAVDNAQDHSGVFLRRAFADGPRDLDRGSHEQRVGSVDNLLRPSARAAHQQCQRQTEARAQTPRHGYPSGRRWMPAAGRLRRTTVPGRMRSLGWGFALVTCSPAPARSTTYSHLSPR